MERRTSVTQQGITGLKLSLCLGSSAHIMNNNSSLETRKLFLVLELPSVTVSLDRFCGLLGPWILPLAEKWVELEAHKSSFGPDTLPSYESLQGSGALSLRYLGKLKKEQSAARGTEFTGHPASGRMPDDLQQRGNVGRDFPLFRMNTSSNMWCLHSNGVLQG